MNNNSLEDLSEFKKYLIYLASPYSSKSQKEMIYRLERVQCVLAEFLSRGLYVYSPIAHAAPVAKKFNLPKDFSFWKSFDCAMILRLDLFWVLKLEGWQESVGVQAEILWAKSNHRPICYVDNSTLEISQ